MRGCALNRYLPDSRAKPGLAPWDRRLAAAVLVASAAYAVAYAIACFSKESQGVLYLFGDFFAFWSESRFLSAHDPAQLYDAHALAAYQRELRSGSAGSGYPFPYPPPYLLAIWPLRFLPYVPAFAAWMACSVSVYLFGVLGARWRSYSALGLLAAPASLLAFIAGQNGFLTAGLMVGSLRLAPSRPWLAGFLTGCLCYKPQFAILLPVALAAAGLWRAFAAAAVTVAALCLLSTACFGFGIWQAWLQSLPEYGLLLAENLDRLQTMMPTVTASLLVLGVDRAAVQWVQAAVALAALAGVWLVFRRGSGRLQAAALCAAAFLVTPYAFVYDMLPVAAAIVLCLEHQQTLGKEFDPVQRLTMLLLWAVPILLMAPPLRRFPLSPALLMLFFILTARQVLLENRHGAHAGQHPSGPE